MLSKTIGLMAAVTLLLFGALARPADAQVADVFILDKFDNVDPIVVGNMLTYTITVMNNGPASPAENVVVTDTLPAGVTLVPGFPTSSECTEGPVGVVTCTVGSLFPAIPYMINVAVTVDLDTRGVITNQATVTASVTDPFSDNDTKTEDTTVLAPVTDLMVTNKSDDLDPLVAGHMLTYTIEILNNGPPSADDVVVTDTLPGGVSLVSTTGCVEDPNGVPTCTLGTVPVGVPQSYTVTVKIDPGTVGVITNQAAITGDVTDLVAGNNTATEDTTVLEFDEDLRCIDTLNKDGRRVSKVQGKEIRKCIILADREGTPTAEACSTADVDGRVAKAEQKTIDHDVGGTRDKCKEGAPGLLYSGAVNANNFSKLAALELAHDLFGDDLDASVVVDGDRAKRTCRQRVYNEALKVFDIKLYTYVRCAKDQLKVGATSNAEIETACYVPGGPGLVDSRLRISSKQQRLADVASRLCIDKGLDTDVLFPGDCVGQTGDPDFENCVDLLVECRACQVINDMDGLDVDCDLFDDGLANASCSMGTVFTPTPTATPTATPTPTGLGGELWAVGEAGTVIRSSDGASWSTVTVPGSIYGSYSDVTGVSSDDVWIVNYGNYDYGRWRGSSWTWYGAPSGPLCLWAIASNNVWSGGYNPFQRWNGSSWQNNVPAKPAYMGEVYDIWAYDASNVWVVTKYTEVPLTGHSAIYYWNGSVWTKQWDSLHNGPGPGSLLAVWGSSLTNVYAGGYNQYGHNYRLLRTTDGVNWSPIGNQIPYLSEYRMITGIHGTAANNIFASQVIYGQGRWLRYNGSSWSRIYNSNSSTTALEDTWAVGNKAWAVGAGGRILEWTGSGVVTRSSGTTNALKAITFAPEP